MKTLITVIALSLASLAGSAAWAKDSADKATDKAVEPSPARTAQREKMKTCNADAKAAGKKGAERKAFMKECLSAKKQ